MASETTTTCTNHCGACGQHFHSLGGFEIHRIGSFDDPDDPRRCAHAIDLLDRDGKERLEIVTEHGECRMYAETLYDVTIWTMAGNRERAQALWGEKAPESPVEAA